MLMLGKGTEHNIEHGGGGGEDGKIEVDGGRSTWRKCVGPRSCGDNARDS